MVNDNYIIRASSEFNVQAELYWKLKEQLKGYKGVQVFGEVRIMDRDRPILFNNKTTRKQRGRLDIGVLTSKGVIAVEVKTRKNKAKEEVFRFRS